MRQDFQLIRGRSPGQSILVGKKMKIRCICLVMLALTGCFPVPVIEKRVHAIDIVPEGVGLLKDRMLLFTNVGTFSVDRSTPKVSEGARSSYLLMPLKGNPPQDIVRIPISRAPRDSVYYALYISGIDGDRFSYYLAEKRKYAATSEKVRMRLFPQSRAKDEAYLIETQSGDFPDDHIPGIRLLVYDASVPERYSIIVIPHEATYEIEHGIGIRLIPDPLKDVQ